MSLGQVSLGQTYRGRLAVAADSHDLKVDLRIEGGTLEVLTSKESLGVWSVAHVSVSRQEDGRFVLHLGDEEAYFRAEDPLLFAYEATSTIRDQQTRFRLRRRAYRPSKGEPRRSDTKEDTSLETPTNGAQSNRSKTSEAQSSRSPRHLRGAELGA